MELKNARNNTLFIVIGIGIILAASATGYYYYNLPDNTTPTTAKKTTNNPLSNLFSLSSNYFNPLATLNTIPKAEMVAFVESTTKTLNIASKKTVVVTKTIVSKPKVTFEQVFKNKAPLKGADKDAISRYLLLSNNSDGVRTFVKFKGEITEQPVNVKIETHYSSKIKKTNATYLVDFSRTITVDRHISAILINDLNSSLSAQVIAQVERNVYASHGDNILIPAGSKIIGSYDSVSKIGDTRLDINWHRIITPRGVNIKVGIETTDAMGRGGLAGDVDNRYSDRYGLSLLVSTINASALASIKSSRNQAIFINTFGRDLTQVTAKILEDNINIKPVITIPHGTRILVRATKDIWFRDADGKIKIDSFDFNKKG